MELVKVKARDGVTLGCHRQSPTTGPTAGRVLFLHGGSFCSEQYTEVAYAAATVGFESILCDWRGHGASGGERGSCEYVGQLEDDLADLINHFRAGSKMPLILGGHSSGAVVCMRYISKYGQDKLSGCCFAAPAVNSRLEAARYEDTSFKYLFFANYWRKKLYLDEPPTTVLSHLPRLLKIPYLLGLALPFKFIRKRTTLVFSGSKSEVVSGKRVLEYDFLLTASLSASCYVSTFRKINVPVLLVCGADDEVLQPLFFPVISEWYLPPDLDKQVRLLPSVNHMSIITSLADVIPSWLEPAGLLVKMNKESVTSQIVDFRFHSGTASIQNTNACLHLAGTITNKSHLQTLLEKRGSNNDQILLTSAYEHWGCKLNEHVTGDYLLLLQTKGEIIATASQSCSHTLYYQDRPGIRLSNRLASLVRETGTAVDEVQMLRNILIGPLNDGASVYEGIYEVRPGETIVWCLESLEKCVHRPVVPKSCRSSHGSCKRPRMVTVDKDDSMRESQIFVGLPSLARRLGEPILEPGFVQFDELVSNIDEERILLTSDWLSNRQTVTPKLRKSWCAFLLRPRLRSCLPEIDTFLHSLVREYQQVQPAQAQTFEQWMDVYYVIPEWIRVLQRICALHGKTLVVPCGLTKELARLERPARKSNFSLGQTSLTNVFDAVQRLRHVGEKNTNQLFNLGAFRTSRFLRKHATCSQSVEQSCVHLLTFDYLVRIGYCKTK